MPTVRMSILLIIRRHLVLDVPDQADTHLCRVVAAQDVADKLSFDLHLNLLTGEPVTDKAACLTHHFQGSSQDAAEDV